MIVDIQPGSQDGYSGGGTTVAQLLCKITGWTIYLNGQNVVIIIR